MKNNILGFIVYLLSAVLFSPAVAVILLAIKENSDRCHYYNGSWNKKDLLLGTAAISVGIIVRLLFPQVIVIR